MILMFHPKDTIKKIKLKMEDDSSIKSNDEHKNIDTDTKAKEPLTKPRKERILKQSINVEPFKPTVLVISSGGIKGIDQLGCLYQFKQEGLLDNINTYIGTSIGAINSLFLNCGIHPQDVLLKALNIKLFNSFDDIEIKLKSGFGVLKHKSIMGPIEELIKTKYNPVPTMKELHKHTGKTLICVTTNLTYAEPMYISYKNFPDLLVSDAVMMSSNIPGIFPMIKYKKCNYIDGAFLKPFAINYLDDGKTDILGITINEENFSENDSPINYAYKITSIMFDELQSQDIKNVSDKCKIIHLKSRHVGVLDRNTDNDDRTESFGDGIEQAKEFIKNGYKSERVPRKDVSKYLTKREKSVVKSKEDVKPKRQVQTIIPRDNDDNNETNKINLPQSHNQRILVDSNFSVSQLPEGYEIEYDENKGKHYIVMKKKTTKRRKSEEIETYSRDDISDEEESDEEYNNQVNTQISKTVKLIGEGITLMLNPSRKAKKEKKKREAEERTLHRRDDTYANMSIVGDMITHVLNGGINNPSQQRTTIYGPIPMNIHKSSNGSIYGTTPKSDGPIIEEIQ